MKGVRTFAIVVAATLLVGAGAAPVAQAEGEPTRDQYREWVEPICQANTVANKRILKNVQKRARSPRRAQMRRAGRQFIRASAVFGRTVGKLTRVPRPVADDPRLRKWFKQLHVVRSKLRKLGMALKQGNRIRAAHEQIRVERASNASNNVSFAFEFRYCKLNRSRFL
jgi:hypothetical protein